MGLAGLSSALGDNETCMSVHSAGESFYTVGSCYVTGNDSLNGLNYSCSYFEANEYFCIPNNRDTMIKILPYDFKFTNSTGNYGYSIFTNFSLLLVVGGMLIVGFLLMGLLWYGTKFIKF